MQYIHYSKKFVKDIEKTVTKIIIQAQFSLDYHQSVFSIEFVGQERNCKIMYESTGKG